MACIQSGGRYVLTNVQATNSCLDLSGGDHRSIIGYPPNGGSNQQWEFHRVEGNLFTVRSGTGLHLRIDGEPADGVRVVAGPDRYIWYVEDVPGIDRAIRLFVPETQFNIDLSDHGNPNPGTPVTLWARWDGQNQLWRLQQV
ncbi:carbohydrate-binding module family 13 protein, partial [Scleroderma yunnanense]